MLEHLQRSSYQLRACAARVPVNENYCLQVTSSLQYSHEREDVIGLWDTIGSKVWTTAFIEHWKRCRAGLHYQYGARRHSCHVSMDA